MKQPELDAIVVGAGFGGIYTLKKLRDMGLSVLAIDAASDVGDTWYWNRYPGAMSDTEAHIYRYSWDQEDLQQYPWKEHYVKQPEVLAYLAHVVERYDLRRNMQFNTELTAAHWDDLEQKWVVETNTGEAFTARYIVTALGLLSKRNFPDIPGLNSFSGEMYHTGSWPKQYDLTGKRVGIIGCGSTGVQVITQLGKEDKVKSLLCFQRTPQYSVPSGDGPVSAEYRESVNARYPQIWDQVRNSIVSFGFEESTVPCMSVSPEERQRVFQENWDKGNGFRFMFGTFCDLTYNEEANEAACEFIRSKIAETVHDPEKRRKLTPHDFYARRPLCDGGCCAQHTVSYSVSEHLRHVSPHVDCVSRRLSETADRTDTRPIRNRGYYEQFKKDNIDVVDLKETPITEITPKGIKTSGGMLYELDVIIIATGFDAMDGNYTRVPFKGRKGETLKEHWQSGPTAYLGMAVADFPNLFMITGPNGAFTNLPPLIDIQADFIADAIQRAGKKDVFEATQSAEDEWTALCERLCGASLFKKTHSWIFGTNIPGKRKSVIFFFGGMTEYRKKLAQVVKDGYEGFRINGQEGVKEVSA